jgi:NhaP-type Na+/H+ or K+/H+ antiporter
MTELTSKTKLKFSLAGVVFMLVTLVMPQSPFDETTQTDWILWGIVMGALLGAATRSFILVAYQWSYQRDRKKYLTDRSR